MRLVSYRAHLEGEVRLGAVVDGFVVDIEYLGEASGHALPSTMLDFIDLGPNAVPFTSALLSSLEGPQLFARPLVDTILTAPIPRPRKNIFGIGLNYIEHVAESAIALDTSPDLPREPVIFSKPPTTVIAPGEPIPHNAKITQQLDWEVEMAVVMGSTAKRVERSDALRHVFGYSLLIDVSARDCRRAGQWIYSKGQDGYCPMGPCIVTADEIPDPQTLDLWLTVNGVEKQRSNTSHMLFKVDELIADISQGISLEPGDIIASGTPAGVGAGRNPQEWLWPGDVVECGISRIGELRSPVVAV